MKLAMKESKENKWKVRVKDRNRELFFLYLNEVLLVQEKHFKL